MACVRVRHVAHRLHAQPPPWPSLGARRILSRCDDDAQRAVHGPSVPCLGRSASSQQMGAVSCPGETDDAERRDKSTVRGAELVPHLHLSPSRLFFLSSPFILPRHLSSQRQAADTPPVASWLAGCLLGGGRGSPSRRAPNILTLKHIHPLGFRAWEEVEAKLWTRRLIGS